MEKNLNQYSMSLDTPDIPVSQPQPDTQTQTQTNTPDTQTNTPDTQTQPEKHYTYAASPTNNSSIIFIIIYNILIFVICLLNYKYGQFSFGKRAILFWGVYLTISVLFILCYFYSPWNDVLTKEINVAKKKMDELKIKKEKAATIVKNDVKDIPYVKPKWTNTTKTYNTLIKDTEKLFTEEVWDEKLKKYDTVIKDTESLPTKEPSIDAWKETIRKYSENIPEKIYEEQLKNVWVEALSKQNRYYLLGFTLLSLLPFFYFLIYILTHTVPEIDIFIQRPFSFLMVILTLFYTAVILLLYTVTKKTYATIIPILLFFFLAGILYFQKYLHLFTTVGIFAICIVESFLVFYNVAFAWCLIPLLPLFFLLFILYTQQQR